MARLRNTARAHRSFGAERAAANAKSRPRLAFVSAPKKNALQRRR